MFLFFIFYKWKYARTTLYYFFVVAIVFMYFSFIFALCSQ